MTPITLDDIIIKTDTFLDLHWPQNKWKKPPNWSNPWLMQGTMPGSDKQGIYALLSHNNEVIYIGVGASLGGGIYEGCGLGSRTSRYTRVDKCKQSNSINERHYKPSNEWEERNLLAIATFGFEPEHAYLSYGLEAFLLSEFAPKYNKIRSVRKSNV
jgi:hypothetical protein